MGEAANAPGLLGRLKRRAKVWLVNNLLCLDYQLNAFVGGLPGQTLSAHAATAKRNGRVWGIVLCAILDFVDPGHSIAAVINDRARSQRVIDDLMERE